MAKGGDKAKKVVIIKKKVGGHGGHHGGSWKVAYADFVTAMMAFFLLMWLISMSSPETKAAVAEYFNQFSLFEKGGQSILEQGASPESSSPVVIMPQTQAKTGQGESEEDLSAQSEPVESRINKGLATLLGAELDQIRDQVVVDRFENGVRIELTDKDKSPLFSSGGTTLTPVGKGLLGAVTKAVAGLKNRIAIEGHTDSKPYSAAGRTNWDLSTERALAARREMEVGGFSAERLDRVAGYAATQPMAGLNPADPRNRRISILVFDLPKAKDGTGAKGGEDKADPAAGILDGLISPKDLPTPSGPSGQSRRSAGDQIDQRIERIYEQAPKSY